MTGTFLFTDLVGSTALGSRLGREGAEEIRAVQFSLLRNVIADMGGKEVKNLGDGLMVVFSSATRALSCAVGMQQAIDRHNRQADVSLSIRVGMSAGEATEEEEDYFGDPVIEAARLCGLARGDQILATEVVSVLGGRGVAQVMHSVGALDLKGIPDPVPCMEVMWEPVSPNVDALQLPRRVAGVIAHSSLGFFGRAVEQSTISEAAADARSQQSPQLVAVAGEPGMGKSTLVSWAAQTLHDDGATVLFGRCDETLSVPFRPWIEAVEHLVEFLPREVVDAHIAHRGNVLARWVPSLGTDTQRSLSSNDVESDRFSLFGAVADLLERAASDRLVVVILDDVQWADAATLELLHHVLTGGVPAPVLILMTYRDSDVTRGDRLSKFLADTRREGNVIRLGLEGLADNELLALMESAAGHALNDSGLALASALHRETKGNPFFTAEVLRHLAATGMILQSASGRFELHEAIEGIGLPTSVRDVVSRRVDRLGEEAVSILQAAAVIGLGFDVDDLVELVVHDQNSVLDVLESATSASLVDEDPDVVGRFLFMHGLVQQTLYQDLSATRRQRMHRRVAEILEARNGAKRIPPAELAAHFIAASQPGDSAKAVQYATAAGDAAMQGLAAEDAVGWFGKAFALHLDGEHPDDGVRCDLLTKLGAAQRDAGDPTYIDRLFEAASLADELKDADRYIEVALAIHVVTLQLDLEDPQRIGIIERALALVDDQDTERRVRLLAFLANATDLSKVEARRAYATEAVAIARASGNDRLLIEVLSTTFAADAAPSTHNRWLADSEWALAHVGQFHDRTLEFAVLNLRVFVLATAGRIDEVEAMIADATQLLGNNGIARQRVQLQQMTVFMLTNRGDLVAAEKLAADGFAEATASGIGDAIRTYAGQMFVIRQLQGRLDELIELFTDATEQTPGLTSMQAGIASMFCRLGRLDDVRKLFPFTRESIEEFPDDLLWIAGSQCLSFCISKLDEPELASLLYDKMYPYKHLFASTFITLTGSLEPSLGWLAMAMGRIDDAIEHFRSGIEADTSARATFWLVETQLDLAEALALRDGPGDAQECAALLNAARATSQTCGFAGQTSRIDAMFSSR